MNESKEKEEKKTPSLESDEENTDSMTIEGSDHAIAKALESIEGKKKSTPKETKSQKKSPEDLDALSSLMKQKDERLKEAHDRLMRVSADFDNYKKRIRKEQAEFTSRAHENFIRDLLPIIDNFERSLEHASKIQKSAQDASGMDSKTQEDLKGFMEGIALVHKQILAYLEKMGVKPISALHKPFDPQFHEALSHQPNRETPHMQVMQEVQKGYLIKDRLLRAAKVVVSNNPSQEAQESETSAAEKPAEGSSEGHETDEITKIKC